MQKLCGHQFYGGGTITIIQDQQLLMCLAPHLQLALHLQEIVPMPLQEVLALNLPPWDVIIVSIIIETHQCFVINF